MRTLNVLAICLITAAGFLAGSLTAGQLDTFDTGGAKLPAPFIMGNSEQVETYENVSDAATSADVVALGVVIALNEGRLVGSLESDDDHEIVAVAVVAVTDSVKGTQIGETVTVRLPGWHIQSGLRIMMDGSLPLWEGDEALFFLRGIDDADADYRLITSGAAIHAQRVSDTTSDEVWITSLQGLPIGDVIEAAREAVADS